MKFLTSGTIKRKLMFIIMLTCCAALILACAAILVFEIADYRKVLRRNTEVMADVIGSNSKATLTFKDSAAATETFCSTSRRNS